MNIYESIAAIMGESYSISKDKKNPQQGFMYRGIDDVMNTFQPLLAKHKVFAIPEVLEHNREERQTNKGTNLIYSVLKVKYHFYAEDGSSVEAVVIGEGMDSGDKASNKAMSVAYKYAMFQTFSIPTEEMNDPDAETPPNSKPKETQKKETPKETPKEEPRISTKDLDELIVLINRKGSEVSKICAWAKVSSLKELTTGKKDEIVKMLNKKPDADNPFAELDDIPR